MSTKPCPTKITALEQSALRMAALPERLSRRPRWRPATPFAAVADDRSGEVGPCLRGRDKTGRPSGGILGSGEGYCVSRVAGETLELEQGGPNGGVAAVGRLPSRTATARWCALASYRHLPPLTAPDPRRMRCSSAFPIESGRYDQVFLDGLNVALIAHVPGPMGQGNWSVAAYIDERADDQQTAALGTIFTGAEGGPMAAFAPLIGHNPSVLTRDSSDFFRWCPCRGSPSPQVRATLVRRRSATAGRRSSGERDGGGTGCESGGGAGNRGNMKRAEERPRLSPQTHHLTAPLPSNRRAAPGH